MVDQGTYSEAYAAIAAEPVRIATTSGIDLDRSRVVVTVSEHLAVGTRLRSYHLKATVSG